MSAKQAADDKLMTKEFVVLNKLGIHARPAALFVKTANRLLRKSAIGDSKCATARPHPPREHLGFLLKYV